MTKEQLLQLGKIYNTLTLVSTKGEDTLTMAECLKALKSLYKEIQYTMSQAPEEAKEE